MNAGRIKLVTSRRTISAKLGFEQGLKLSYGAAHGQCRSSDGFLADFEPVRVGPSFQELVITVITAKSSSELFRSQITMIERVAGSRDMLNEFGSTLAVLQRQCQYDANLLVPISRSKQGG